MVSLNCTFFLVLIHTIYREEYVLLYCISMHVGRRLRYPLCQCCDDIIRLLVQDFSLTTSEVHFSSLLENFSSFCAVALSGIISTNDVKENNGSIVTQLPNLEHYGEELIKADLR